MNSIVKNREDAEENSLFRPEAIEEARNRFGKPANLLTVHPLVAAGVGGGFVIWLLAAGLELHFSRKETAIGYLLPVEGIATISAPRAGVVVRVLATEGAKVRQGQPIFVIDGDREFLAGQKVSSALMQSTREQVAAEGLRSSSVQNDLIGQIRALDSKESGFRQLIEHRRRSLMLERSRLNLAQESEKASRLMYEKKYVSAITMRQREDAVIAIEQQIEQLESDIAQATGDLHGLAIERGRIRANVVRAGAESKAAMAEIEQRQIAITSDAKLTLSAPRSGMLTAVGPNVGSQVSGGATLASIMPRNYALKAEMWMSSKGIGQIESGQAVRLMYDAFPYQKFGVGTGRVKEISRAPNLPAELPGGIRSDEPLYRVTVSLDSQELVMPDRRWKLVPGMRFSADIIQEKESIWEILFSGVKSVIKRQGD